MDDAAHDRPRRADGFLSDAAHALADLAAAYWRFECEEQPFTAIMAGEPTDATVLFRDSAADHARRAERAREMAASLAAIGTDALSARDRVTHRLLAREFATIAGHHAVHAHLRPWLLPVGPDFNSVFFANGTELPNAAAAALYVARLGSIPAFLADVRDNLSAGHGKGIRYPAAVLAAAAANTRAMTAGDPAASAWQAPFGRSPAASRPEMREQADAALAIIRDRLVPALRAYADHLDGAIADGARDGLSCVDTEGGEDYYRHFVRHFTTTDMSPDEVHALGLSEVARLEAELTVLAEGAGHAGDLAGFRARATAVVATSADELRMAAESLCKQVDKRIPAFFGRVPRATYGVDTIPPAQSAAMPPAYAQPSPADRSAPGILWATGLPSKCPLHMLPALVLHEAWPGHLMHIALMQEQRGLPAFRRHGAVKYTACVEGWALYCEWLGIEMGLYRTAAETYGRLEMELWRAIRLVVDTGIHWHRWSRADAIAYMTVRLSLPAEAIAAEVDRYAAMPGQALAYQVGGRAVRAMRARAEAAFGARFDRRAFHDLLTGAGAMTLPVMDAVVDAWIEAA